MTPEGGSHHRQLVLTPLSSSAPYNPVQRSVNRIPHIKADFAQVESKKGHEVGCMPRPRSPFVLFKNDLSRQNVIPPSVEDRQEPLKFIAETVWGSLTDLEKAPWIEMSTFEYDRYSYREPGSLCCSGVDAEEWFHHGENHSTGMQHTQSVGQALRDSHSKSCEKGSRVLKRSDGVDGYDTLGDETRTPLQFIPSHGLRNDDTVNPDSNIAPHCKSDTNRHSYVASHATSPYESVRYPEEKGTLYDPWTYSSSSASFIDTFNTAGTALDRAHMMFEAQLRHGDSARDTQNDGHHALWDAPEPYFGYNASSSESGQSGMMPSWDLYLS